MHGNLDDARNLAQSLVDNCTDVGDREIVISPPYTALESVKAITAGSPVKIAGQNMHWSSSGAYTGEISPLMLKDLGCPYVILGHSERRQYFSEDDSLINKKVHSALEHELVPILCVGETLQERETNRTNLVLEKQIRGGLKGVSVTDPAKIVVAYEPVWAIGTGKTAKSEQAQEVHCFIRGLLNDILGTDMAVKIRILYGGSVKPDNVDELMNQPDIDGTLVGGASLKAESFLRIIKFVPVK